MPDDPDLVDLPGLARLAGVTEGSVRVYYARAKAARQSGVADTAPPGSAEAMPPEDYRFSKDRVPVWKVETLQPWLDARGGGDD